MLNSGEKEKKERYNERCPVCGRLIRDPENIPNKEKFKSTFIPRIHGHGASAHGPEKDFNAMHRRLAKEERDRSAAEQGTSGYS